MHTLGNDSLFKQCCKFLIIESPTVFMENGSHSTMERSLKNPYFSKLYTLMKQKHFLNTKTEVSFCIYFTFYNNYSIDLLPKNKFLSSSDSIQKALQLSGSLTVNEFISNACINTPSKLMTGVYRTDVINFLVMKSHQKFCS